MRIPKKLPLWIFVALSILVLTPCVFAGTKTKGVQGYVKIPNGSMAYNASVRVHVIASAGIGSSIPCTTDPAVLTDISGYYITNLANLKKDSDGSDCGDLWYAGDSMWAVANGSTVNPLPYFSANSSITAVPDNSGGTTSLVNTTLQNSPPSLSSISEYPSPIAGGAEINITPSGQTDENLDNISLVCCFDASNTCTPTVASNQCSGNWENISTPYSEMNCTYTTPVGVDSTYYARCRLKDYLNYSSSVRSASFIVDDIGPVTYDDFAYNNTWRNSTQTITITPDCGSTACTWTHYCTENDSCYPHNDYAAPIVFSSENLSYLRYNSNDTFSRIQTPVSKIIKIDKGGPIITGAAVTIENSSVFANSTALNFNWTGFNDNLSGINGYYYSFTNNQGTTSGTFDASSPGQLAGAAQGAVNVFVWAIDNADNIGFSVNDSIIVDSNAPTISNVQNTMINHTYSGSIRVNATINDSITGFNLTPKIEYKYGSDLWSAMDDLVYVAGNGNNSDYTYNLPQPAGGWSAYRGQLVYWNITAQDIAGNIREMQYNTTVTSINLMTFNVHDRVLGRWLSGLNISGGTQCAAGCIFTNSTNITELNGAYTFTIKKSGFSTNTSSIIISSQDIVINVTLDDTQPPSVSFINYSVSMATDNKYYARIYANITDNFNLDSKYAGYSITEYFSDSGRANFTGVSGDMYVAQIGPYNESFYSAPSLFANDSYGLNSNITLSDVWYVFVNATSAVYNTGDDTLELVSGWNLISVPFVENHSVEAILNGLSNGNWGCGRNGHIPVECDPASGDFEGNFTKIMTYNESDSTWITFNPTDLYTAISDEGIRNLSSKKGYWINMTHDQDITLDLKFD